MHMVLWLHVCMPIAIVIWSMRFGMDINMGENNKKLGLMWFYACVEKQERARKRVQTVRNMLVV